MRASRQLAIVVALVIGTGLLQGASAGGASDSKTLKVSAHFVYVTHDPPCLWGIGVEFPSVKGAASYLVKYYDGYYKRTITTAVTPSAAATEPTAPKGTLYLGVTGGGYSPPCNSDTDATEGGRFSKGATAYAIFDKPIVKLSGTVIKQCGCSPPERLPGVSVVAKGAHGSSAVTGSDGTYEMAVQKGTYTVTPSLKGFGFAPPSRKVTVNGDVKGVDFRGCDGSGPPPATGRLLTGAWAIPLPSFCLGKVDGDLLNRAGGGIVGFPVVIRGRTKAGQTVSETAVTDHSGHYEIHLADGKYTIDLSHSALNNLWRPSDKRTVTLAGGEAGGNFVTSATCGGGGGGTVTDVTRLGTSGRDVITVGLLDTGPVVAILGDGNDVFRDTRTQAFVCTGDGNDEVTLGGGDDAVDNSSGDDTVTLGAGNDIFRGSGGNETVDGGPGNDDINTFDGNDKILGGDGDDNILAGAGNDVVDAGPGKDTVDGYTGNDRLTLGAGPNASVDGGDGTDFCFLAPVDLKSIAHNCETIRVGDR